MEKAPKKLIYIYTLLSWTLTILALVFRILARVYSYDSDVGYFESGAPFPTLHYVCLGLLALLAFAALFLFHRPALPASVCESMKKTCVMEKTAASVGGIAMLVVSIATILFYWSSGFLPPTGFTLFGLLTAVLSVFYFLCFWIPSAVGKPLHILGGAAYILHFVYILGVSYFELYTPMNNPVKLLLQITAITAIFYLLSDLRFYLDIPRPTRYIFSSILFLGFASVSVFSGGMFTVPTKEYTMLYYLYSLVNLALLVLAAVRLTRMLALWAQYDRAPAPSSADEGHDGDTEEFPSEDDPHRDVLRESDPVEPDLDAPHDEEAHASVSESDSEPTTTRQDGAE